eukprot:Seg1399.8 transcript_id=Seg1399.8/GoldUCD/mRNA.D3Y31 product="Proton-coupled folate transporter" protein_id=Seg1399.8/GoldUCD/D3Y31
MANGSRKSTRKLASEPFLLLYVMCFGANISLFPQLVISKLCHQRYNKTVCQKLGSRQFKAQEDVVYTEAATWDTIIFFSISIPALFAVLPVGAFANMISKRKILFLPPVLIILQSVLYIICARYQSMHLGFVALAAGLTGIFGDFNGAILFAFTYMASVTDNDNVRTLRFAILEGSLAFGKGFGTLIAGVLLKYYGFTVAFSLGVSASLINILFIAFYLQEPSELNRKKSVIQQITATQTGLKFARHFVSNMKASCTDVAQFARHHSHSTAGKSIGLLLLASFFVVCALFGEDVIITLFVTHSPLSLSPDEIGLYSFTLHTIRGAGPLLLAAIAAKSFRPSDFTVITMGSVSILATHVSMALSTTKGMLFGFTIFALAFPFAMGGINACLTKLVGEDEHATVLSYIAFISLLSVNVIEFSANKVFMVTAPVFPGASMLLFASLSFIAFLIVAFVFCVVEKASQEEKEQLPLLKPTLANQEVRV